MALKLTNWIANILRFYTDLIAKMWNEKMANLLMARKFLITISWNSWMLGNFAYLFLISARYQSRPYQSRPDTPSCHHRPMACLPAIVKKEVYRETFPPPDISPGQFSPCGRTFSPDKNIITAVWLWRIVTCWSSNCKLAVHTQHEELRVAHAKKMAEEESKRKYARRRHAGERPFAMIKQHFGVRQFLTRGLAKVRSEWLWLTTAFNLHRLMRLMAKGTGPPTKELAS